MQILVRSSVHILNEKLLKIVSQSVRINKSVPDTVSSIYLDDDVYKKGIKSNHLGAECECRSGARFGF